MKLDFNGQNVVITAGASGIGYEIAKTYEELGADVFVCDISEEKNKAVAAKHDKIHTFTTDMGDHRQVEKFFAFSNQNNTALRRRLLRRKTKAGSL